MNIYTNQVWAGFRLIYVVACFSIAGLPFEASAKSRPARPALPEGESLIFRANDQKTNFVAEAVSGTVYLKGVQFAESWSGESLLMTGETRSYCMIPAKGTRKRPNFSPNSGSIRLWFSVAWTSTALGGQGPGTHARLMEIAHVNARTPTGFALYFDPDGNTVYLSAYHAGQAVDIVHATVALEKDVFHQFGVVYGPEAVTLILDGKTIATNRGLPTLAHPSDLDNWLCYLGSNPGGLEKLQGRLDEIYFFPYACTEEQFGWDYQSQSLLAAMGPVTVQEELARYRTLRRHHGPQRAEGGPTPPDPGPGGGGGGTNYSFTTSTWTESSPTNCLRISKIVYDTNAIDLTIAGGETNGVYDLFYTTNLVGAHVTNSQWTWFFRGTPGQTNFVHTNAPTPWCLYTVGATNDSNADGLSDVYDLLVGKGNADANSNGLPDAWEWKYFGNFNQTADGDYDGDGISNLAEYQNGTDPTNPDTDYDGVNDGQELADGTDPLDANSVMLRRLGHWTFNDASLVGEDGQMPRYTNGLTRYASWSSNAVGIPRQMTNAGLIYQEQELINGTNVNNINCRNGSVALWFQPNWDSGAGPGTDARLLEMGEYLSANGWYALGLDATGTNLYFGFYTNGMSAPGYLQGQIAWQSNHWYNIVLTHSPTNRSLYVNGQLLVNDSTGVTGWPSPTARGAGIRLGINHAGLKQPDGQYEELETFNYPLTVTQISSNYQWVVTHIPALTATTDWYRLDTSVA
ncbi:MAG: LamG-like jellyroll fold domain-containing protein, partial [Verrucomicrobiota bacterium]